MALLQPQPSESLHKESIGIKFHSRASRMSIKLDALTSQHQFAVDIEDEIGLSSGSGSSEEDSSSTGSSSNNRRKIATNRAEYGTWTRPMDFTLTIMGHIIGLHNFFRFPHMCYKYGMLTFLLPYVFLMVIVGLPLVFMESTVGQYYGVGSMSAFKELAPIVTGVSYILAWNSFLNCWLYGIQLTWLRAYSGDSLSCLKGWVSCHEEHYYNTPYCFTGPLDECCTKMRGNTSDFCPVGIHSPIGTPNSTDTLFFNYGCVSMNDFCSYFGWTFVGNKMCKDTKGKLHSIYERRTHATNEYFYGYVLGMRKHFVEWSQITASGICPSVVKPQTEERNCSDISFVRNSSEIRKAIFTDPKNNKEYWEKDKSQYLQMDPDSSSFIQMPTLVSTTILVITFFLFDNLLSVSLVTYILSSFPFCVLTYIVVVATGFDNAIAGLEKVASTEGLPNLWEDGNVWAEALIQVLLTCGAGNGALISLASFNKYHHMYLFDVCIVSFLNILTSIMATLICFCTIGHYTKTYGIHDPWTKFIPAESEYSSIEFAFIVYSYFLSLLDQLNFRGKDITTLLYFFMLSTFPTDTTIRLAQNVLDATVYVLPRLRYHSTMALLGVSFFYLLTLLPITRNGGATLFIEFEYFTFRFAIPTIVLIEVISIAWVYKASRLMDNAETLGAVSSTLFRKYIIVCLKYIFPFLCILLIGFNCSTVYTQRFKNIKPYDTWFVTILFGWVFSCTPAILFLFSVLKQINSLPKSTWGDLLTPLHRKYADKKGHYVEYDQERRGKNHPKLPEMHHQSAKVEPLLVAMNKTSDLHVENDLDPIPRSSVKKRVHLEEGLKGDKGSEGSSATQNVDKTRIIVTDENAEEEVLEDGRSLGSSDIDNWRSYILWNEIMAHYEDWPDRLDDSEVESEGSSIEGAEEELTSHF